MSLQGTLIQFANGTLAVEYQCAMTNEPKMIRHVWPLGHYRTSGMSYCRIEDAIGKTASVRDGYVSVYLGNGNYLNGTLTEGGSTKSLETSVTDIPAPKCRTETRWRNGRWEKLLRKGWVAV